MPSPVPFVWAQLPYDSTDNPAKFCHSNYDQLLADDGWINRAATTIADLEAKHFPACHLHNAAGRGGGGPKFKGQWNGATSYSKDDIVEVSGSTTLFRKSTQASNKGNDPMSSSAWVSDTGVTWDGSTFYNTYTSYANNQIVAIPRTSFVCRHAVTGGALFNNQHVWGYEDGLGMVIDAWIKRRTDGPWMVKNFRKAWKAYTATRLTRHYFGCPAANDRVLKHLGRDRGLWASGQSYERFDRVMFNGFTWQTNTEHTSSGSNDPVSSSLWYVIDNDRARNFGPARLDRYFRRLWDSVEVPISAGMHTAFDFTGPTVEDDPVMGWFNWLHDRGIRVATEASPLLGYSWLFKFDTLITSEFLPTVELGGFAEPLANIQGDVSIMVQSEPGYGKTYRGNWSASSVSYGANDAVLLSGTYYWSKQAHISSGSNVPGTGGGAAFWQIVLPEYYYIPGATFANQASWFAEYLDTMFNKGYSVIWPPFSDAFAHGEVLEDYYPSGYTPPSGYIPPSGGSSSGGFSS